MNMRRKDGIVAGGYAVTFMFSGALSSAKASTTEGS